MKNLLKNLALAALILAIATPAFAAKKWKVNKDGTVDIELWYGAAVTEAGPPPADWVAYKIIREKLGINLIATMLPSSENDQLQKINAAGAARSLPDIFMCGDQAFQNLVKQRLVAEVDDMYAMMPNRTKLLYDKDSRDKSSEIGPDGKLHSYGLAQPGTIVRNEGVIIREDWLKHLGLKVPKTTAEYVEVMKAFTTRDPDGNGKADTYGFGAFLETKPISLGLGVRFDPLFGAYGVAGTWNLTRRAAGLNIKKPEYFDAMTYVKGIVDAKVIDPNWLAYKKDDFRAAWKQGRFGIFREQNMALHGESNYTPFDNNFPNGDLVVIDPPVGPKGLSSAGAYEQSYRTFCLAAQTANDKLKINGKMVSKKEKIAQLLEWMSSDEGYYLLGYGVEGVNYVKGPNGAPTEAGLPDPKKGWGKSSMQPLTQLRNMVYYNGDAELETRYGSYTTAKSKKVLSPLKTLRTMQSKPWTACNGVSKLDQPTADVERFYNQGISEFMTGKRQLTKENWNAWLAEFDKNGGKAWEDACLKIAREANLLK